MLNRRGPFIARLGRLAAGAGLCALLAATGPGASAAPIPAELAEALAGFRADGPKGWSFTQTTATGDESQVEHFDPLAPEFRRWTLVEKNGRPPSADELENYFQGKTRRTAGITAPRIQDQLDAATATRIDSENGRSRWRFQMKPGGADDISARFLAVTLTFHEATRTIERLEIASLGPFSPVLAVKILETKTVMSYGLPTKDRPSLLERVTLHLRGRAFWFKSLDQDMTVTFSDQTLAVKK